jgi:hypothetical protein
LKTEVGNAPGAVKVEGLISESSLDGAADDKKVRNESEMYVIAHNNMMLDKETQRETARRIYRGSE